MSNVKPVIYTIDNFKTVNQKIKRNLLAKDTGYYAQNLRYDDEYGSITKRLSRAKYNSASVDTTEITSLYRFYKNSTNSAALINLYNGSLTIGYDASGVFSEINSGLTSEVMSFITYKDLLYLFNGSDTNMVFTLVSTTGTVEDMGIPSLATTPSGTVSNTAGNLSATVYYAMSLQFDGYQEGNVSPSSSGINVNGSKCTVGFPTSTLSRCTGRYLYRTKANSNVLYRLTTITNNSDTMTYGDNTADTSLDTTITGPIDYGIPASYKYAELHKERLFLANNKTYKSRIIYSDLRSGTSYPDVFPANNNLKIAEDDGDEITFIKNDQLGQLIVSKKNSVRVIHTTADSDLTWSISDPYSVQGCIAPYTATTTPFGILYLTRYGEQKKRLVLWNGNGVQIIPELEGIEPILSDIAFTDLDSVRGHYHNGYYYMTYRDPSLGTTTNNRVLIINIYNWSISIDKKNVACFCSWNGGDDRGELYTGTADATGTVYREDTSTYDLLLRYKSDIDVGTFSRTASSGAEGTPSIGLAAGVSSGIGARSWVAMKESNPSDIWSAMTNYDETWYLAGQWLDTTRDISAKALSMLYWYENKPANTDVDFYIRLGDTTGACESAAWNGPYSTPAGTDISSVTAAKYIQMLAKLFVKYYGDKADVSISRRGLLDSDFIIKVSSTLGTIAETTIEFNWESGRFDLGDLNEAYKRVRKRLRSVKIEYDRESTSGSFDFAYYLNGSTTARGTFNTSFTDFPRTRIYSFPLGIYCEDFFYQIYSNTDVEALSIRKVIFTISIEPYFLNK